MSEVFPSERLGPASVRFFPRILTIIILACGKIISRGAKRILGGAKIILASEKIIIGRWKEVQK